MRRFLPLETAEGWPSSSSGGAACEVSARRVERWMQERMPTLAGYQPLAVTGEVIAEVGAPPVGESK
jgi:hypothetical protein